MFSFSSNYFFFSNFIFCNHTSQKFKMIFKTLLALIGILVHRKWAKVKKNFM